MVSQSTLLLTAILAAAGLAIFGLRFSFRHLSNGQRHSPTPSFQWQSPVHAQCTRSNPHNPKDRPLLILKYARTGSTWLSRTGSTIELESGKEVAWTHEVPKCGSATFYSPRTGKDMAEWFKEYFGRITNGTIINTENRHKHHKKCIKTAGQDPNNLGMVIATYNPHPGTDEALSDEQWQDVFDAVPDLAIGLLVRTNIVKKAISEVAVDWQKKVCGGTHKLTGNEECIKDLPDTIDVDLDMFWNKTHQAEMKRVVITDMASRLATKFGDGKIFCLSYEGMQQDVVREMRELGEFISAPLTNTSLHDLGKVHVSHKRGSDDLSTYIKNYDELHEFIQSKNPCLIEQLEDKGSNVHPVCGVYTGEDVETY